MKIDPATPRRHDDGSLVTFTAYGIESGEPVIVDDRTFNAADHVLDAPGEKKKKGKKEE